MAGVLLMLAALALGQLGPGGDPVPEVRVTTGGRGPAVPCPECH